MVNLSLLAVALALGVSAQVASPSIPPNVVKERAEQVALSDDASACQRACTALVTALPDAVFIGKAGDYAMWDAKQDHAPACRIEPSSPEDVSAILKHVKKSQCHFAIKSGGHARFAGASNAIDGVTIDLVKLNTIALSADKKTVTLGAGLRWGDVYQTLEKDKLTVVGGRVADVGVGGIVLGGGISFFSGRHGLASDSVLSYDLVLPDGEFVTVSQKQKPELFKALKGAGSSNFGVITSFVMETIPLPNADGIWFDYRTYLWDKVPQLHKARLDWMTKRVDDDNDFGGYDVFGWVGMYNMSLAITQHIHTTHTKVEEAPKIFEQYEAIEAMEGATRRILPMSNITFEISATSPYGLRNTYAVFTYKPTAELDEKIFAIYEEEVEKVKSVAGVLTAIVFQPLARSTLSKMSKHGGNSLGLKESDAPLVIFLVSWQWAKAEDDELMMKTGQAVIQRAEAVAKEMGRWHRFKYINYAEDWQADDIYSGYGEDNLKDLQKLQKQYDPEGVFGKGGLCGGYFKLNEKAATEKLRDEL